MEKCSICGKIVVMKTCFGKETLCMKCENLLKASSWNKREFVSIDDLKEKKASALYFAEVNNVSEKVVDSIKSFFAEYEDEGFVAFINGKSGQTLKIFDKYCIINTKNGLVRNSISTIFSYLDPEDEDDDEVFTADDKLQLAKGVLKGGLIKTGIGVAMSAGLKQSAKEQQKEKQDRIRNRKLDRLVKIGEKKILFEDYKAVDTFSKPNIRDGYLKFIPKKDKFDSIYDCDYFFFNNAIPFESKKIKSAIESAKNVIEEKMAVLAAESKSEKKSSTDKVENNEKDNFEEIRKYKQLLDEGIITADEFEKKKKELLNL